MINNLGVDPDEWFENPSTDKSLPLKLEDEIEVTKEPDNIHEIMYQLATKNGTTITMGGGSEEIQK